MARTKIRFLHKPTCISCRKAKSLLLAKGAELEMRDLVKEPQSVEELDALIGDRDYTLFLNPRHELYRRMKMKTRPPSRAEALRLMAREPNLIRRPVVVRGREIVLGYDEAALKKL
jgi:Spx/MgsR family transcriptional regulator